MARRLIIRKKKHEKSSGTNKSGNKNKKKSFGRTAVIGLFGGLLWSLIALVCKLINFTSYGPELLFKPFALPAWKNQIGGQFLAVAGLSLLSIVLAWAYLLIVGRFKNFWISLLFGLMLWALVFIGLQPFIPDMRFVTKLGWNTASTTICLFLLYGLFVGYSISFEMEEANGQEQNYSNE
ncbi:MAG: YqhR family membrane protein [Sporolactobacillus sp.]